MPTFGFRQGLPTRTPASRVGSCGRDRSSQLMCSNDLLRRRGNATKCGVDPTDARSGGCAGSDRRRKVRVLGDVRNTYSADNGSWESREANKLGRGRNTRMRIPGLTFVGEGVEAAWPRDTRSSLQVHTKGEGLGSYSSTGVCRHFTTGRCSRLQQHTSASNPSLFPSLLGRHGRGLCLSSTLAFSFGDS